MHPTQAIIEMPIRQLPRAHIVSGQSRLRANQGIGHVQTEGVSHQPLQFGSITSRALQGFFQPVTENYLAGFMAQDVIALWIPRIIGSLDRGRIPYNPEKDQNYGKRNPGSQRAHHLKESVKGLNWWNGWEETGREFQSGPGFMLLNGLVFLGGCRMLAGKRGLLIAYPQLKQFFAHLSKISTPELLGQLGKLPEKQKHAALLKQFLNQMTAHHFDAQTLQATLPIISGKNTGALSLLNKGEKSFQHWLSKLPQASQSNTISIKTVFDNWSQQYVNALTKGHSGAKLNKVLKPLENHFNELVYQTNVHVKNISDPNKLSSLEIAPLLKGQQATGVNASQFTEAMEKFSTTIDDLIKKSPKELTIDNWQKHLKETMEKMVTWKMPLSILATFLGGINHFYVSSVTQVSSRNYPANRLIRLEDLPNYKVSEGNSPFNSPQLKPLTPNRGGTNNVL